QLNPCRSRCELALKELGHAANQLVEIDFLKLGRRHFRKITEASDDGLEVGDLSQERGRAFAENLIKLLGRILAGADEVLYGDLQRKERILQLVGQAASQFPPRSYALALHQALPLRNQLLGHLVEGGGQLADFVFRAGLNADVPIALS